MKKLTLFLSAATILSLTSCKKNYTCQCTGNPGTSSSNVYTFTIRDTKSKATSTCKTFVPTYNECHIQ
ncbi:MAG: hypothetical protein H0W61_16800 [Bacteroidetes bacterium]|nr:hypothetical protein [Bacteroidota bacterium]